jgi:hypothetical protein
MPGIQGEYQIRVGETPSHSHLITNTVALSVL